MAHHTTLEIDPTSPSTTILPSDDAVNRDDVPASPSIPLARTALWGLAATTSTVLGALLGGAPFETHLPGAWYFGMPGGFLGSLASESRRPSLLSLVLVFGGLIVLCRVWFGFLHQLSAHHGFPVKKVVLVVAIWALPLLIAPPLFSREVYSYAGQGEMVSHHIDPYTYGTGVLGSTPFSTLPDSIWSNAPSPYGPTFLGIDAVLDKASGHKILPDIALLRLLELAGLALIVASTPTLARAVKRDPAEAVLLGAGSPLALATLIAGAHNEGLMLGLLMAGLAVAKRFGTVPGLLICGLAAGVKSPAALGVLFLGWVWAGSDASIKKRLAHTAGAVLIGLASLEAVTLAAGTGWGWVGAAKTADKSFTGITPISVLARAISVASHVVHLPVTTLTAHTVLSVIGVLCAAAICLFLLVRSPKDGMQRCLGLALLALAILGPVLWAWYVMWGVIILAPVALGRLRVLLMVIVTFETFVGTTSVIHAVSSLFHNYAPADLVLFAALAAIIIMPLGQFTLRRAPAEPIPSPRPNGVLLGVGSGS
jgi:hypothetical protein